MGSPFSRDYLANFSPDKVQIVPAPKGVSLINISGENGAPGTIRTSDPQIRSLMLYPAELRARIGVAPIVRLARQCKPVAARKIVFYGDAMKNIPIIAASLILLAGCTHRAEGYPPLTPRPAEANLEQAMGEPKTDPVAIAASTPATADTIAALLGKARAAEAPFAAAAAAAWPEVSRARGAARGTENWVAAQMAISRVETLRAPVKAALSDLDAQRRLILLAAPSQDQALVEEAVHAVEVIDAGQGAEINRMLDVVGR